MNRFRIVVSLFVVAGAVVFIVRHQSLRELRVEQEQLQQRAETNSVAVAAAPPEPVVPANTGLSDAERSELLRLRGQIGPLRQEFAQATNQLARIARAPRPAAESGSDEPTVSREEIVARMNRGKQWAIGLILYAGDHNNQFPNSLAEISPEYGQFGDANEFEFVQGGVTMASIRSPATTFIMRERQSNKMTNGRWSKAYVFADGHVENATADTPDFTDWEAKHLAPQPQTQGGSQ